MSDREDREVGPDGGVSAFLRVLAEGPEPGAGTGKHCDGCGREIMAGQHYLRAAIIFATAGMDAVDLLRLPDATMWTKIFDDPLCAGLALVIAAEHDELFTDVFRR